MYQGNRAKKNATPGRRQAQEEGVRVLCRKVNANLAVSKHALVEAVACEQTGRKDESLVKFKISEDAVKGVEDLEKEIDRLVAKAPFLGPAVTAERNRLYAEHAKSKAAEVEAIADAPAAQT